MATTVSRSIQANHTCRAYVKNGAVFIGSIAVLLLSVLVGLMSGAITIPAAEVWSALVSDSDSESRMIVWNLRLPRVLTGVLVGINLSIAGALLQGIFRNPLADPGIIGVSSGGGLAAVIIMILMPAEIGWLPISAFAGALAATVVIYLLSWKGGASPVRLILAGVAVNALLGAAMSGLMILNSEKVQSVLPWMSGTLNGRGWMQLDTLLPYSLVGVIASLFLIKQANLLTLGDDAAKVLGTRVEIGRLLIIIVSAFLAGSAISIVGMVGFVGLVVPHICRLLVGNHYRILLPVSAVSGGALVVLADTAARTLFDPIEFPVGILLALLGTPFFLYLLRKGVRR